MIELPLKRSEPRETFALQLTVDQECVADKLALVIPTLREAANIGNVLMNIRSVLDPAGILYEILVVDDDSQDGTEELVSAIAQRDKRVRLLIRKDKKGLAGAVLHGWQHSNAGFLGVMDADFQHPPELLPKLLSAIKNGRDLAIGSRYTAGGDLGKWNPVRKLLSFAAVWATLPLQNARLRASDPMSGLFMVRRDCIEGIPFQTAGFKLLLEILVRGRIHSIEEVPFAFSVRSKGVSKANFKVGWDYAWLLVCLYANKFRLRR